MFRRQKETDGTPSNPAEGEIVVVVDEAVSPYLVMFHEPAGYRAEQMRALRNRLVAMNPDGEPKSLVLTSAVRGEGKTVSALNLAMAFAELEWNKVVIVDADLRRPCCERYLNLNQGPGFSDVLLGNATIDNALRPAGYRQLSLLGAGSRVSNPSEVLGASRIDGLLQRLKERFQYIVIDTPPVLPSTDAGVLAARADGTVVVVRLEHSIKSQTKEAVQVVGDMGGNVLGTFITGVRGQDPESDRRLAYEPREIAEEED